MRRYFYIAFIIILATASAANASFGEGKNQDNQQQGERGKRSQTIIKPDGDFVSSDEQEPSDIELSEFQNERSERISDAPFTERNPDSLEDNSVSKYNFIFYFLYKFKYSAEESP